jgi:hypothetical protein
MTQNLAREAPPYLAKSPLKAILITVGTGLRGQANR